MKRKAKCGEGRKLVQDITDRAKRYRANAPQCKPAGPKRCALCGSNRNVVPDHKDGDESNGRKSNLRWLCKSCNTRLGKRDARLGRGRRTHQYNPGGYFSERIGSGRLGIVIWANTPAGPFHVQPYVNNWETGTREVGKYKTLATARRKAHAYIDRYERNPGAGNLAQYVQAAVEHTRRAHDAGGKVIHETPKARRKSFAREIAFRKSHKSHKNPAETSEALYKKFHGHSSRQTTNFPDDADYNSHRTLAQLGLAVSLYVGERCRLILHDSRGVTEVQHIDPEEPGWCVQITFKKQENPPHVAATPNGHQIYFVGGNQDISEVLPKFHVDIRKDLLDLGPCLVLEYHTQKGFDHFVPRIYFHALAEESGGFAGDNGLNPRLMYNHVKRKLYLVGGVYEIHPDGIVD
jgi:hypothetical protein